MTDTVESDSLIETDLAKPTLPRSEWIGVLAVLAFAVVPDVRNAIVAPLITEEYFITVEHLAGHLIYRSFKVSLVVIAVILLTHASWKSIGMVWPRLSDSWLAIVIWIGGLITYTLFTIPLAFTDLETVDAFASYESASNWNHASWFLAASLANGFAEEVVIRGYLLTRFEKFFRSTWAAIFVSSFLFASYHIYQGYGPAISICALGIFYGAMFCKIRRLWPLVFAHAITDFVGMMNL